MELSRVTVTIKENEDINEVAGLLASFDFIVTMIDKAAGELIGFIPSVSVQALSSIDSVASVEETSVVGAEK